MKKLFMLFAAVLCICVGCGGGGGGGAPEPAWHDVPAFTVSEGNPNALLLPSTDASGGPVQELQCTMTSRGYWATGGHIAILLRYAPPPFPGLSGAGLAIGKTGVITDETGKVCHNITEPRPNVEVWAVGAGKRYAACPLNRDSIVPPETLGPVLADATPYPMTLRVGKGTVRYTMAGYDSGDWPDPTSSADTGILVTTSAHEDRPGWRMEFTDCRQRWSK